MLQIDFAIVVVALMIWACVQPYKYIGNYRLYKVTFGSRRMLLYLAICGTVC